jgi:tetratricopeptide (TPR) repeat protein
MKKYLIYITVATIILSSCESKLEIDPAQSLSLESILSSESGIKGILIGAYDEAGQAGSYGGDLYLAAELLGSNNYVSWNGTFQDPRQFFQKNMQTDNGFVDGNWTNAYETINQLNIVLDNLNVIEDADERDRVEGEAKFLRALSYFDLVRFFGDTYQAGGGNTQLGVPLRLTGITSYGDDLSVARSTVEQVYTQVITDLTEAIALLPSSNEEFADEFAARGLLARVYLQQGAYALARDAANTVIASSGRTLAASYAAAFNNTADGPEDIFTFQVTTQVGTNDMNTYFADEPNGGRGGDVAVTANYLAIFDDVNDDRRSFTYVSAQSGDDLTTKFQNQFANLKVLRLAEMYLIRAECNQRLTAVIGDTPLNDINALRLRANATTLGAVDLSIILTERERELGFEGHLLHDYKRTGRAIGVLASDDEVLVMPIPIDEMNTNPLMVQNSAYIVGS